jgi:hypothetical protein
MAGPRRKPIRASRKPSASQQRGQLNRMAARRGASAGLRASRKATTGQQSFRKAVAKQGASAGRRAASKASQTRGAYAKIRSRKK